MRRMIVSLLVLLIVAGPAGCHVPHVHHVFSCPPPPPPPDLPRELSKVALPTYRIEPPDILIVEAIHVVPRSPYLLRTGDMLGVHVAGTLPDAPINGNYPIQPGGIVNLGMPYGSIRVSKLTVEQAQEELLRAMLVHVKDPVVAVSLVEMAGTQQIAGQHLVGPDGTITLGTFGSVPIVGLSLAEAKHAIESNLAQFLEDPEVSVDVFAYNSMVYYVITEGAGLGDGVTRFPITGNETVLDAISHINGLPEISSKRIWIARPSPHSDDLTILPVDWRGVTKHGSAGTNFQIMPGDRVFVAEDKLVAFDTNLEKLLAPLQRAMGFALLGVSTAGRLSGKVLVNGRTNNGGGFGGGGIN